MSAPQRASAAWESMSSSERAVDDFLRATHLAAAHQIPALVAQHAAVLGASDAVIYLSDLQQTVLVPYLGSAGPRADAHVQPLSIDTTLAGLAYQRSDVLSQRDPDLSHGHEPDHDLRLWLPLVDGTDRLGVLGVIVDEDRARRDRLLRTRLWRFATLVAEVIVSKTQYGDDVVRAHRQTQMGLAAEIQWGVLPPLTFACGEVVVAGALEPAYEIAGDSVDYAVDAGLARFAVFDGMGHGLQSAQLAALAVASYRNGRRSDRPLTAMAQGIDSAVESVFSGTVFTTGVLAELDTDSGVLSWVNAGHPEPLLLRQGRLVKSLHLPPSLPFGLGLTLEAPGYLVGTERLQPGDHVLLYTDGVVEARSPQGEFFGVERLTDLLARHEAAALSPAETIRRVVRSLMEHQQGHLNDDATLLLVEYRSGRQQLLLPHGVPPTQR
jgi:hypothetical protein